MSADESITNLPEAVAVYGALPVPVLPEPQALSLSGPICSQAEARAAGLDIAPSVEELDAMASTIVAAGDPLSAEVSLAQAVPLLGAAVTGLRARVAELEALAAAATEYRVWEPGYGLYVRRSPGAAGFAILEARRTDQGRRAWTTAGLRYAIALSDAELYCWPDAESAVSEARRVLPGAVVREDEAPGPDAVTRVFSPVASLREPGGEFYGALHHAYRLGHDLPETGSQR